MIWILRGLIVGVILYDWCQFAMIKGMVYSQQDEIHHLQKKVFFKEREIVSLTSRIQTIEHSMMGDGK